MTRDQLSLSGPGDTGVSGGTKINANAAKNQALQTAVGIPDGATSLGAVPNIPVRADQLSVAADTAKARLDKHEARIYENEQANGSVAMADLGVDYDLTAITGSIRGTTYIPAGGANLAQYPLGEGLYKVESVASSDVVGTAYNSAGYDLTIRVTREHGETAASWVASRIDGGAIGPWTQDSAAIVTLDADADWLALIDGGRFVGTWDTANSFGQLMPSYPQSGSRTWLLEIARISSTQAYARAVSRYALHGADVAEHAFVVELTKASGSSRWSNPSGWSGTTGGDLDDASVFPKSSYFHDRVLTRPAGFEADFAAMPKVSSFGVGTTECAATLKAEITGTEYWVDALLGSDGAAGSKADPFASIAHALGLADAGTIWVAPGRYGYDEGWGAQHVHASVTAYEVRKWNVRAGEVIISTEDRTAWVASGVGAGTFECDVSFPYQVIDLGRRRGDGSYTELREVATEAEVLAEEDTWWIDTPNDRVVIHMPGGVAPTDDVLGIRETMNVNEAGVRSIYGEGLTFVGGTSAARIRNTGGVAGGLAVFSRCTFVNAKGAGIQLDGVQQSVLEDCRMNSNGTDGITYGDHSGKTGAAVEIRCKANGNGVYNAGGTTSNGSSAHDAHVVLRVGCSASDNAGPQYADVLGAKAWNVNCYAGPSASLEDTTQHAGFQALSGAQVFLYRCQSTANLYDLVVDGTSDAYTGTTLFSTVFDPGGRVRDYLQL